jgi:hypothetical protein
MKKETVKEFPAVLFAIVLFKYSCFSSNDYMWALSEGILSWKSEYLKLFMEEDTVSNHWTFWVFPLDLCPQYYLLHLRISLDSNLERPCHFYLYLAVNGEKVFSVETLYLYSIIWCISHHFYHFTHHSIHYHTWEHFWLTNSKELSPSWEAASCAATQELRSIL